MGVRPYEPALGRFLSVDPVDGGSATAYDYADQDPVNEYDLEGDASSAYTIADGGGCYYPCYLYRQYSEPLAPGPLAKALENYRGACAFGTGTGAGLSWWTGGGVTRRRRSWMRDWRGIPVC